MNKLIIGFVFYEDFLNWSGGKNYYLKLINSLSNSKRKDFHVKVFLSKNNSATLDFDLNNNITIIKNNYFSRNNYLRIINLMFSRLFGNDILLNRILKKERVDILSHYNYIRPKSIATACWIPDFQPFDESDFYSKVELKKRIQLIKRLVFKSDYVFLSSHSMRDRMSKLYPDYLFKAFVLRFCHERELNLELIDLPGFIENKHYIYIPNQFWIHKNHKLVLAAVKKLVYDSNSEFDLVVVFSGNQYDYRSSAYMDEIKSLIEEYNLNNHILILGNVSRNIWHSLMIKALFIINPSKYEGWSTIVEEAKSYQKHLILSDIPVHLEQSKNSVFFDRNSPDELADKIQELSQELLNPSLVKNFMYDRICIFEEYMKFINILKIAKEK